MLKKYFIKMKCVNLTGILFVVFVTIGLSVFQSCGHSYLPAEDVDSPQQEVITEDLVDLAAADLEDLKKMLQAAGINMDSLDIYAPHVEDTGGLLVTTRAVSDLLVRAIKVTTTTKNPDGSGTNVPISGVLLVPRISFAPLRILVAHPSTYTHDDEAPSNVFKSSVSIVNRNDGSINLNLFGFFALQATQGFAVLIPDYPGFGDSHQKAFIPYLLKKQTVDSSIDLIKAAQEVLKRNRYSYKKELILSGYSLGAYAAVALTRELDKSKDMPVRLTVAGGTPVDLLELINVSKTAEALSSAYVFPYVIQSYDTNAKGQFAVSDVLRAPYDKTYLNEAFNGLHTRGKLADMFSGKPSELFTDEFLTQFDTSPKFAGLRNLLIKNSIEPWRNANKLVLTHGISDELVPYNITKKFYDEQRALGGNIHLTPVPASNHISTVPLFFVELSIWARVYR